MLKCGFKYAKKLKEINSSADNASMEKRERRKYPRVDASNLITYCCLDDNENELEHCMARALEVSPAGIKIETFQEIESEMIQLISVDADDVLIDIKGRVIHSRQTKTGRYLIGASFEGTDLENTRFVLKLLAVCQQIKPAFVMMKRSGADGKNRRKYPRVNTNNLVSYSCLDENGNELDSCMAMAIDVNPLGAKIETYQEILSENIYLTSVDVDDNLIGIVGRVAHTHKAEGGRYEFGIQFLGTTEENIDFALKLINAFHRGETSFGPVSKARS